MILIFFIYSLFACEFNLNIPYDDHTYEYLYEIPEAEFTALGIWTRYFAFNNVDFDEVKEKYFGREINKYTII